MQKIQLSWVGKIAAFKMQTLPKIIYYFRCLPIPIPAKFFKQLNIKLRQFIWNKKKTRVAFSILTSITAHGGMNLPDIRNYYYAAILDQMKYWFSPQKDKLWLNIEQDSTKASDLYTLALANIVLPKVVNPNLLSIKATLFAWKHILSKSRHLGNKSKLYLPTEIINYCKIRMSVDDWIKQGYYLYVNLPLNYKNVTLCKLGRCKRLRDFNPENTIEIPSLIWDYLSQQRDYVKKGISYFYNILSSQPVEKNTHMIKWEKNLDVSFSWDQWKKSFQTIKNASSCIEHWDNAQKITNRWYLTPYRLSKIYPTMSDICWRCKEQTGNLLHTLWSCKSLRSFWNSISSFIADFTGNLLTLTPASALLGIDLEIYPTIYRTVVTHILIASRLTVAKLWKSTEAPNISTVINRVNTQAQFELMLAYKNHTIPSFRKKWKTWLTHHRASAYLKDCNI